VGAPLSNVASVRDGGAHREGCQVGPFDLGGTTNQCVLLGAPLANNHTAGQPIWVGQSKSGTAPSTSAEVTAGGPNEQGRIEYGGLPATVIHSLPIVFVVPW
jgi:hypothetical protein